MHPLECNQHSIIRQQSVHDFQFLRYMFLLLQATKINRHFTPELGTLVEP